MQIAREELDRLIVDLKRGRGLIEDQRTTDATARLRIGNHLTAIISRLEQLREHPGAVPIGEIVDEIIADIRKR